ncbi:septal ring lytic transglycosylase RlpA family protein [Portibacter lacus]|uniref:Probable endolytic peptidoglycan transglycosylase RlpA n=1 Tax=Portibacter lacus TaxID=1099794 RepID=A0AA37SSH9_9BACT|nr:septal ring lytic transglycosylase RlpA family protein [Portibacter lacus]GLR18909.1 hypothetical protein GCM10007940_35250 [Portibacter lacus]
MLTKHFFIILSLFLLSFSNCTEPYNFEQEGRASYYANLFIGKSTASGEIFSQDSLTAAHPTLPFGTEVLVTNIQTGKSIKVTINDRGPFVNDRIIDLTRRAADTLEYLTAGVTDVKIQAIVDEEFLVE